MKKKILLIAIAAFIVGGILSPFASSDPDGLEKVAIEKGFIEKGEGKEILKSPIPDYLFPGIKNEAVATGIAGIFGTGITFGLMYGLSRLLKARKENNNELSKQ